MKTPGYILSVKLFLPAPKTDFKAQAAAANFADAAVTAKSLTPELLAAAKVISVEGKFGSAEVEAGAVTSAQTPDPTVEKPAEPETVAETPAKKRGS